MDSVPRPSASMATSRTRSGSRAPSSSPTVPPSRTVPTLRTVPAPTNSVTAPGDRVAQQARDAGRADPPAVGVADDDLVGDQRAAAGDPGRHPGHQPVAGRAVVGGVDVDADGHAALARR